MKFTIFALLFAATAVYAAPGNGIYQVHSYGSGSSGSYSGSSGSSIYYPLNWFGSGSGGSSSGSSTGSNTGVTGSVELGTGGSTEELTTDSISQWLSSLLGSITSSSSSGSGLLAIFSSSASSIQFVQNWIQAGFSMTDLQSILTSVVNDVTGKNDTTVADLIENLPSVVSRLGDSNTFTSILSSLNLSSTEVNILLSGLFSAVTTGLESASQSGDFSDIFGDLNLSSIFGSINSGSVQSTLDDDTETGMEYFT